MSAAERFVVANGVRIFELELLNHAGANLLASDVWIFADGSRLAVEPVVSATPGTPQGGFLVTLIAP